jgi:hypothetical protein
MSHHSSLFILSVMQNRYCSTYLKLYENSDNASTDVHQHGDIMYSNLDPGLGGLGEYQCDELIRHYAQHVPYLTHIF